MSVKVRIAAPLRRITREQDLVEVNAGTLAECVDRLEQSFPGIKQKLADEHGELHPFINVFINGEDARFLEELATPLKPGDEVSIVPAVAGG